MSAELEQNGAPAGEQPTPVHETDGNDPISQMLGEEGGSETSTAVLDEPTAGEPAAELEQQPLGWQETARQYGHEDLAQIEDEGLLRTALFDRLNEAYQYAILGQQYLANQQQFQQNAATQQGYQNQQPAIPAIAPQFQQQQFQPQAPAWNPYWSNFLQTNPKDGSTEFKPFTPPNVVNEITQYAQAKQQADAFASVQPNLQPYVGQLVQQGIQQYQQQVQQRETIGALQSFMQQNHGWLANHDPNGKIIIDPRTGDWQLSPAGFEYFQNITTLGQAGVTDPFTRIRLAAQLMSRRLESQQPQQAAAPAGQQPAATPTQKPRTPSRSLRNVALRQTGRGNSVRNSGQPGQPVQGTKRSFQEDVVMQLEADGIDANNAIFAEN